MKIAERNNPAISERINGSYTLLNVLRFYRCKHIFQEITGVNRIMELNGLRGEDGNLKFTMLNCYDYSTSRPTLSSIVSITHYESLFGNISKFKVLQDRVGVS